MYSYLNKHTHTLAHTSTSYQEYDNSTDRISLVDLPSENSHDKFIAELIKQYIHKVATGQTRKYKTITYNHIDDKTYEIHLIPIKKQLQDFIPVNTEIDRSPDTKKILKIISKTPGITQAELSNRSRFVDIATRKQILEELINAGLISCEVFQLSPKTKKTRKYTLNKNNHEIEKVEDDETVPLPVLIPEHVQKKLEEIDAIYSLRFMEKFF